MRLSTFLLLVMLTISQQASAGKRLKVLFIGNSYTYVNNLPQITADIAASMGDTLDFDTYAVGSATFMDHCYDPLCAQKIRSAQWDYVVLQEQSMLPSQPTGTYAVESYMWGQKLDTMIASNDPCTKVVFYMTWGYKNGDPSTCQNYPSWPYSCTYDGMDSLTNLRYRAYADTAILDIADGGPILPGTGFYPIRSALVAPVGAVRHYVRDHYPAIELYQTDDSHPSEAGSYAGACSFYVTLFRKDPTLILYNYVLNNTDAENIKMAAKQIAYDSMAKWYIGTDLRAQFTFATGAGSSLSFTNTSTSATGYSWDFGDGSTSVASAPTHTYAGSGIYSVRLIAFNASCSDTTYAAVNTPPTAIGKVSTVNPGYTVSPNPAQGLLYIHTFQHPAVPYQLSIINTVGQAVYFKENSTADQQINISGLNSGMYLILIKTGSNVVYKYKVLKL